jgi:hypothetical protein
MIEIAPSHRQLLLVVNISLWPLLQFKISLLVIQVLHRLAGIVVL